MILGRAPSMNPNPIKIPKPLSSGDFSIRSRGSFVGAGLTEEFAWRLFLDECRGGGHVELIRGAKPVAWLKGVVLPS
jgi:hypothetical protein